MFAVLVFPKRSRRRAGVNAIYDSSGSGFEKKKEKEKTEIRGQFCLHGRETNGIRETNAMSVLCPSFKTGTIISEIILRREMRRKSIVDDFSRVSTFILPLAPSLFSFFFSVMFARTQRP